MRDRSNRGCNVAAEGLMFSLFLFIYFFCSATSPIPSFPPRLHLPFFMTRTPLKTPYVRDTILGVKHNALKSHSRFGFGEKIK